jgi:hypothetical protein
VQLRNQNYQNLKSFACDHFFRMRLWQYAGEFCTAQWQAGQRRPAKPSGFRGPLPLIIQIPTLKKQIIKVENETLANAKSQQ